jgi:hypothetical protein
VRCLLLVSVLASCGSQIAPATVRIPESKTGETKAAPPKRVQRADTITSITLERTRCFGSCPEYGVTVTDDGLVTYRGISYVKERGSKIKRVPLRAFRELGALFESGGFEGLSPPWKCPPVHIQTSDLPSATLTLRRGEKEHRVEHYLGDGCAPKVLGELEEAVDKTVDVSAWIRCEPEGWCPDP